MAVEKKGIATDTAHLKDRKRDGHICAGVFVVETKDNKAGFTALGEAKAILCPFYQP